MVDPTQRLRRQWNRGFTLMELLVVIVILAVIATMTVPRFMSRPHEGRLVAVEQDFQRLDGALQLYKMDHYHFPTTKMGLDALTTPPEDPEAVWRPGGYIDRIPKDPWGHSYRYRQTGSGKSFELSSLGADSLEGGEGEDADIIHHRSAATRTTEP